MSPEIRFSPYGKNKTCPRCGSVLGRHGDQEDCCPAPSCNGHGKLLPGVDPSYLYRARALLFVPECDGEEEGDCQQIGRIIAIQPEHVRSAIARKHALVVATNVCWPRDRKHFGELFEHNVHHTDGPLVHPPNDGWDSTRPLPVQ